MTFATKPIRLVSPTPPRSSPAVVLGGHAVAIVTAVVEDNQVAVAIDRRTYVARRLEGLVPTVPNLAALVGREVLVFFPGDASDRPVVTGLLAKDHGVKPEEVQVARLHRPELQVDGNRLIVEAKQEISLRCGQASLTLTADGRIVLKGMEIVSRAMRAHKIKGGTVNIN
jgi:hypothetical protein